MRRSKRSAVVFLCGISLLIKPAYAFWPVFDFTEIVPILQQIQAGKKSIDSIRSSLASMDETKKAIGGVGSLGSFSDDLFSNTVSDILALSNQVTEMNEGTTQIASVSPQIVNQAVADTISSHAESINNFVDEVRKKIFKNQTQHEIVISYNDLIPWDVVYEEEEEEVSTKKSNEEQEALIKALDLVMAENKQIATELNDTLETLLTVLNRAATTNTSSLVELKTVVKEAKVINDVDKEALKKRIDILSEKQQDVTDRAAALLENLQQNYNEKYNQVIKDGTENFVKASIAYVRGDEEKGVVEETGQKLKQDAAAINIVLDNKELKKIELISKDILAEAETLKTEMEQILKKNKKNT